MRIFTFFFTLYLALLSSSFVYSQDVHYSQRLVLDRERNPTFFNHFDGKWQLYSAYRQQWAAVGEPFVSSTANLVRKIKTSQKGLDFFAAAGFTNDQSGDVKLDMNQLALVFGAQLQTEYGTFEAALNNQWVTKSMNLNGVTFPEQYDRSIGRFNEQLASGENLPANSLDFFNFNFGLSWEKQLDPLWRLRTGLSLSNLTEPEESFFDENNRKNRGYGLQLLGSYAGFNGKVLEPYLSYYRAKGASELVLGSALSFQMLKGDLVQSIKPFLYVRTGVDRQTDALIVGSRVELLNFDLGLSYDVNVSELELATQNRGSFELSLVYTLDYLTPKIRRLPCERY